MSTPLFGSLLLDGVVLSDLEKTMIADYQEVCSLNLFPDEDFVHVEDMASNHFHKWCVEVLAAHFWDLFKPRDNENAQHLVRVLKYRFRQGLAQLLTAHVVPPLLKNICRVDWDFVARKK